MQRFLQFLFASLVVIITTNGSVTSKERKYYFGEKLNKAYENENEREKRKECETILVEKKGWDKSDIQNKVFQFSCRLSDIETAKDFVLVFEAENGLWTYQREHPKSQKQIGTDWGLCGTNDVYNEEVVKDKRFLTNEDWQIKECWRMWRGGTRFYGEDWDRKQKAKKNIKFKLKK